MSVSLNLASTQSALKAGDYSQALNACKQILQQDRHLLAQVLTPLYKELLTKETDLELRVMIVELYLYCQYLSQAIEEIEEIIEINPDFPLSYTLLGRIYKRYENKNELCTILEKAYALGSSDPVLLDLLPSSFIETQQLHKGISFFKDQIEKDISPSQNLLNLAELYEQTETFEALADTYEILSARFPNLNSILSDRLCIVTERFPLQIRLQKILVQLYFKSCHPQKALRLLSTLIETLPLELENGIALLKDARQTYPNHPDIELNLCCLLIQNQEYSESVTLLQALHERKSISTDILITHLFEILSRFPQQIMAASFLSEILFETGKFDQGFEVFQTYLDLDSILEESTISFTDQLEQLDRYQNHCPHLLHAIRLTRAKLLFSKGQIEEAAAIARDINTEEAQLLEISCLQQLCTTDFRYKPQLRESLYRALVQSPYHPTLHQVLVGLSLQKEAARSALLLGQGHPETALEHLQRTEAHQGHFPEDQALIMRCFLEMGRFDLAVDQGEEQLRSEFCRNSNVKQNMSFMMSVGHFLQGDSEEAIRTAESIYRENLAFPLLEPMLSIFKKEHVYSIRGKALGLCLNPDPFTVALPNPEDALLLSKKKMLLQSFAHSHNNKGVQHTLKQNNKAAEKEFFLAMQLDEQLPILYQNMGVLSLLQEQADDALEYFDRAQALNANISLIYLNRGICYQQMGEASKAIEQFEIALKMDPEHHFLQLVIGDFYKSQGDLEKAFLHWERASQSPQYFFLLQRRTHYLDENSQKTPFWLTPSQFSYPTLLHLFRDRISTS